MIGLRLTAVLAFFALVIYVAIEFDKAATTPEERAREKELAKRRALKAANRTKRKTVGRL